MNCPLCYVGDITQDMIDDYNIKIILEFLKENNAEITTQYYSGKHFPKLKKLKTPLKYITVTICDKSIIKQLEEGDNGKL